MRFLFCIVFIAAGISCIAQDDDMPDYRSKRDNLLKIAEKDIQADVATFSMAGIDINNGRPAISSVPLTSYGDNFITFDSGNIKVTLTAGLFVAAKHKLQYIDKYLVRIDTKAYFGMYSKVPKKTIQSLTVVIDGDSVAIPPAAYADLYEPGLAYSDHGETKTQDGVFFSGDVQNAYKRVYVYMLCNDGMGGYEVTFVIQDKKYYRRILDANILKN